MKKLQGLKSNLDSFENQKLSDLSKISGGRAMYSETKPRTETCNNGCEDTRCYLDNGKIWDISCC